MRSKLPDFSSVGRITPAKKLRPAIRLATFCERGSVAHRCRLGCSGSHFLEEETDHATPAAPEVEDAIVGREQAGVLLVKRFEDLVKYWNPWRSAGIPLTHQPWIPQSQGIPSEARQIAVKE